MHVVYNLYEGMDVMSKYEPLWKYISSMCKESLTLSYKDIEDILGFPIDHSFLTYKKELLEFGYKVEKVSMKRQTVEFIKEI